LSCVICEIRKEKRFCPAVHGRICPQCCGEQREVTLDCPSDCPYLQQARQHEKPRPAGDFDAASLFLHIEVSALSAMCTSYERLANSGLHYEQPLTSRSQQSVAAQIEEMVKQYREAEQKQLGYSNLRDADVLGALVFLLRLGHGRTSGRPKSRAFIDFLVAQFPEQQSAVVAPQDAGSRIIVP
jgi:hypothetical protein